MALMNDYINKQDAFELLEITSLRTLQRYAKEFNFRTKNSGVGLPTYYHKDDILKYMDSIKEQKSKYSSNRHLVVEKQLKEKKRIEKEEVAAKKAEELSKPNVNPLGDIAKDEMARVEQLLKDKGHYDDIDRATLITYAISYERYIYYSTMSHELDSIDYDAQGNKRPSPYHKVMCDYQKQMESSAKALGIYGIRSRVGLKEVEQEVLNPFADLIG